MACLSLAMDFGTGQPLEWVRRYTLLFEREFDALPLPRTPDGEPPARAFPVAASRSPRTVGVSRSKWSDCARPSVGLVKFR